jgi:putative DNA primase/helicase
MAKKVKRDPAIEISVIAEGSDEWGRRYFLLGAGEKPIPGFPPVLASRLIQQKQEVLGELANAGLGLYASSAQRKFFDKLQKWGKKDATFKVATKIGWNDGTYVLPDKVSNPRRNVYTILGELDPDTVEKYRRSENTLKHWQENIGNLCVNNSRLMFSVAVAFTGPILRFVTGERSGGFQIYGDAETGKTTAAMVAGSIWGCHRHKSDLGFLESWNTTENAVEMTALAHNDVILILDETKKAGSTAAERIKVVLNVIMRLAQQQGKKRLTGATAIQSWRFYFLSTSNFSLDEMATTGGAEIDDADRGRLVDIPLPKGARNVLNAVIGKFEHQLPVRYKTPMLEVQPKRKGTACSWLASWSTCLASMGPTKCTPSHFRQEHLHDRRGVSPLRPHIGHFSPNSFPAI